MIAKQLLLHLTQITVENIREAERFRNLPTVYLYFKRDRTSWNILECIEHLNRYGHFYLPELSIQIGNSTHPPVSCFESSTLGNFLAKRLVPQLNQKKGKTSKKMNPNTTPLDRTVLDVFIEQQYSLLALLNEAQYIDLQKTKASVYPYTWLKLRLGDILKIVVFHNLRHIVQAQNIIQSHQ